jgi:hypothetical protein
MTKKVLIGVLVVLLAGAVFTYYRLGGFNDPVIEVTMAGPYTVAGRYYEGSVRDKSFGALYDHTEEMIQQGRLPGKLCAIYYNDPEKENGQIKAFVGALLPDEAVDLPEGLQIRRVPPQKVVRGHIDAHYTVAPGIYNKVHDYAKANELAVSDTTLEIYHTQNQLTVEIPVRTTLQQ